ncbi:hypothetical protein O1L44_16105 [Streptomyces noursei]|nr:hypothetical protein [Streptomyces noursei]
MSPEVVHRVGMAVLAAAAVLCAAALGRLLHGESAVRRRMPMVLEGAASGLYGGEEGPRARGGGSSEAGGGGGQRPEEAAHGAAHGANG